MRELYHIGVTIYVELVIFNNLFMDAFIGAATLLARRKRIAPLRLILSSAVGAGAATAYPLCPVWGKAVIATLLCPAICLLLDAYGKKGRVKEYLKNLAIYILFTLISGGGVYAMSNILRFELKNSALLGACAAMGLAIVIIGYLLRRKRSKAEKRILPATLLNRSSSLTVDGLCDSGNLLVDNATGLPVVIISKELTNRLGELKYEGYIEIETAGGGGELRLVKLDGVEVDGKRYAALGAISNGDLADVGVILQASMF